MAKPRPTGVSEWVSDLLDVWIADMESEDSLDFLIAKINRRKLALQKQSDQYKFEVLLKTYKDLPAKSVLYAVESLRKGTPTKGKDQWFYHRCILHSWHPRKKAMWVEIKWSAGHEKWGRQFMYLKLADLKKYRLTRTEPDVRHRALKAGDSDRSWS
jgi:hypothetical protein